MQSIDVDGWKNWASNISLCAGNPYRMITTIPKYRIAEHCWRCNPFLFQALDHATIKVWSSIGARSLEEIPSLTIRKYHRTLFKFRGRKEILDVLGGATEARRLPLWTDIASLCRTLIPGITSVSFDSLPSPPPSNWSSKKYEASWRTADQQETEFYDFEKVCGWIGPDLFGEFLPWLSSAH